MLIGVNSVDGDEVWTGFWLRALFWDEELEWDRVLPKDDDRAESVGERDDEWLFLAPPEALGPVGGGADESNVLIMACSSADLSLENIIQYEVARDQVYAGLKRRVLLGQQRMKSSGLRQDVHGNGKQWLCMLC